MQENKQYPLKANKTQHTRIIEVFGEQWVEILEKFLGDIIELYPYEQWNKDTTGFKYKTVGGSSRSDNMFYVIGEDGNLYLKHQFSLFPTQKPELTIVSGGTISVYDLQQAQGFFNWVKEAKELSDPVTQELFSFGSEKACICVNTENNTNKKVYSYEEAEQFYNQPL